MSKSNRYWITASVATTLAFSHAQTAQAQSQPAVMYTGGDIITMVGDSPQYVQALVEQGGKIVFTGTKQNALRQFPSATQRNLRGQTLLPGFIDAHGHMYLTGFFGQMANVMPAPDGPARDFDSMINATKAWMDSAQGRQFIETFGWVVASGYDDSQLRERASPTAEVLDRITTDYPVVIIHQSSHIAALNTKGLAAAGITRDTPNKEGGVIRRRADGSPNGIIEEETWAELANLILAKTDRRTEEASMALGQDLYRRNGFTTAQEGRAFPYITAALGRAASAGKLNIDVAAYADIVTNARAFDSIYRRADGAYTNHLRIAGAKIGLDGSPQAMTAWLTAPYFHPHGNHSADYRGYATMPDARALAMFDLAASKNWQILCHANGDAAIDQCLNGMAHAQGLYPNPNHRSVVIHGQTMRADQVTRLAQLKGLPSFFPAHTFYWGDYHRDTVLGEPRADRISPTRDARNAGMTLTSHHDAPVVPPNAMRVLDATVNRVTRSGRVLGAAQRLTPYESLQALTVWSAIQHFEEATKGTLSVGKNADLVVLSANPLRVPRRNIHSIRVAATIKDGRTIFCDSAIARIGICP